MELPSLEVLERCTGIRGKVLGDIVNVGLGSAALMVTFDGPKKFFSNLKDSMSLFYM